jgi:methylisocitrate lyase
MIEGGMTPILPLEALQEMGFLSVGYVLSGLFSAARALEETYAHLLRQGSSIGIEDSMMTHERFPAMLGLEEQCAFDAMISSPVDRSVGG